MVKVRRRYISNTKPSKNLLFSFSLFLLHAFLFNFSISNHKGSFLFYSLMNKEIIKHIQKPYIYPNTPFATSSLARLIHFDLSPTISSLFILGKFWSKISIMVEILVKLNLEEEFDYVFLKKKKMILITRELINKLIWFKSTIYIWKSWSLGMLVKPLICLVYILIRSTV